MARIFKSLDAATSDGPGAEFAVGGAFDNSVAKVVTLQVSVTGSDPTLTGAVFAEGSIDGVNWGRLGGWYMGVLTSIGEPFGDPGSSAVLVDNSLQDDQSRPRVRYVRARLSGLTGGATPAVTAYICASDLEQID